MSNSRRFASVGFCPNEPVIEMLGGATGDGDRVDPWEILGPRTVVENKHGRCQCCSAPSREDIVKMFGSDPIGWKVMDNIFTIGGEEDPDIVLVHPVCADSATKTPERIICEHSGIKFVADGVGVAPRVTSSKLVLAKDSEFIVVLTVPEDLTKLDFGDGGLDGNNQVTWTPEDSGTIHCGAASYSAVKTAVEVWVWRMPG